MEYRRFGDTYVVRMDRGEEITEKLKEQALKENIKLAQVTALGAVSEFTVGVYRVEDKKYLSNDFAGAYEITALTGSINTMNGQYYSHLHITCADESGRAVGGHLNRAVISVTCEMFVRVIEGTVDRKTDPEIGINLFDF